ncbi:MAG TPA: monovalent cation/H+ antiporter complex subunit F [bacterium]|jgi:multicomponent Na+:H+ antiporter subunit F|nr:monovalent cation/H+ antiporter complex subunit F [bacterium]HOB71013.1 monovalent cation/H+ antiporter complex subunit F [bacterium]HOG42695.1 monovalent cation/H+ antiporter complex subunit F [bacterium]HPV22212.1 monovalent cation/H+ antiporter complex subunit F [bacterium]HPY13468.1 monovalent cation/H+ antiporter complex subunit F [bacterium]
MVEIIIYIALSLTLLALIISVVRFAIGPKTINRIVSLDVIGFIAISLIVMIAHFASRVIYLDVALVYGLLSFLGVIVVARFIERGL